MGVIGTSAGGYATVLPTQGNPIGEAMSNVENSAFRYSAQKMAKEKAKQDAERDLYDRRRQEFEANKQWSIENPYVSLGNGSEGVIKQSYMNLKDMASQSRALALSTGDPKYQVEYDNAVMGAKSLAQMPTAINSVREKIATDPSSFNPVSLKKTQDFIDSELVAKRGENGTVVYDQVKKDENGNVKVIETGLTPARIKQLTETIPALNFNGSEGLKGESVQEKFNKLVGKPRKVTKIENGIETTDEIVVGAEQLSEEFADQMIQDRNNLYNIFHRIGIDPENQNNYKDPKKVEEARSFIERNLFASNATTTSTEPNYEGQKSALANRSQSEEEWYHRAQLAKDKEPIPATTYGEVSNIGKSGTDTNSGIKVAAGDKVIPVVSKTTKNGDPTTLKTIVAHQDGSISVSVAVADKANQLNPEAIALKESMEKEGKVFYPQPSNYIKYNTNTKTYNSKTGTGKIEVERALLNQSLPDGTKIKNFTEGKKFIQEYSGVRLKQKGTSASKQKPKAIQFDAQGNIIM